ncbi:MAG TPA: methyl-accepting chemotaxis protein [Leptospiraceae bacterium]|nr:methyl-accepting chemotaxis protein [Leptospiraceae bacterium]HNF12170.1 methyl-accepting chemotaxis protein [Leptospiraceae bacterium]HNF23363.1 methyl-accepting chemotaxis protein [Leptospiraceae bacterium]
MKIRDKLFIAFAGVIAVMTVCFVYIFIQFGSIRKSLDGITHDRTPKVITSYELLRHYNQVARSVRNLLILDSPEELAKEMQTITELMDIEIPKQIEYFRTRSNTEKGKELVEVLAEKKALMSIQVNLFLDLIRKGKKDEARLVLLSKAPNSMGQLAFTKNIGNYADYQRSLLKDQSDNIYSVLENSYIVFTSSFVCALFFSLFIAYFLIKNITQPMRRMTSAVDTLGSGNLNVDFEDADRKDELGQLSRSFQAMTKKLQMLIAEVGRFNNSASVGDFSYNSDESKYFGDFSAIKIGSDRLKENLINLINSMNEMSDQHTRGDIDVKIDSGKFQGSFREMAEKINTMVFDHIKVKKSAVGVFREFGEGNFEANMEILPGKKRFINETIDQVRSNLKLVISEINSLSASAIEGKLSVRADVSSHKGDFRKIIEGVNQTLDSVIKPVQEASSVLAELAEGNLTETVKGDYKGDHAIIKNALNKSIESFSEILADLAAAAEETRSGVNTITDSNQALSQGSSEQAASIEEISSTVTELSAQAKQATVSVRQANEISFNSLESSKHGSEMMEKMMNAMQEIKDASDNISKILASIDEIAFQTNLLALNAAVEAARAGRYGKGFAVVAEEVKSLSGRSANAAKETAVLIQESIQKANKGVEIASRTVKALDEISSSVKNVTGLMTEVSKASEEQMIALSEVEKSIQQIEQVIQNNAFSSEETASASLQLSEQAENISKAIRRFRLPAKLLEQKRSQSSERRTRTQNKLGNRNHPGNGSVKNPSRIISLGES